MSLTQAEAVMEVIAANGRQGAALAKSALDGRLAKRIGKIQTAAANAERPPDRLGPITPEEDVPELSDAAFVGTLMSKGRADALISGYERGRGAAPWRGLCAAGAAQRGQKHAAEPAGRV